MSKGYGFIDSTQQMMGRVHVGGIPIALFVLMLIIMITPLAATGCGGKSGETIEFGILYSGVIEMSDKGDENERWDKYRFTPEEGLTYSFELWTDSDAMVGLWDDNTDQAIVSVDGDGSTKAKAAQSYSFQKGGETSFCVWVLIDEVPANYEFMISALP